jgi:hypothetical protein
MRFFFGYKPKTYLYLSSIVSKIFSDKINRKLISLSNNFGNLDFIFQFYLAAKTQ